MPGPRRPFSFATPGALLHRTQLRLISTQQSLNREIEMSREIDRLQAMRRTVFSPSPTGQFGDRFADVAGGGARFTQTSPDFLAARETARRFGVILAPPAEPS